jgi:hypothetical protein
VNDGISNLFYNWREFFMNKKYFILFIFLSTVFFYAGCESIPYTISEKDSPPDTAKKVTVTKKDTGSVSTSTGLTLKELKKKYPAKNYAVKSYPRFTLQFNAVYNYGLGGLNANYSSIYEAQQLSIGENFGVRQGFGALVLGKIPVAEEGSIRATFIGSFNYFFNNSLSSPVSSDGRVHYYVSSLGIGMEDSFTPGYKIKPYISGGVLFNVINGGISYTDTNHQSVNIKIKPTIRVGVNVGTGIEYLINKKTGLNFGVNLTCSNLLIKSSNATSDPNNIPLRDKKLDNPIPFSGYKQFLFISFYAGVNLYFGITETKFHL